jgi:hypothetical protein
VNGLPSPKHAESGDADRLFFSFFVNHSFTLAIRTFFAESSFALSGFANE